VPTAPETAYAHGAYAASLMEIGTPRHLLNSGGWVLERTIRGADGARDAMGCYPLFTCKNWDGLRGDLEDLGRELVSLVVVTDPMASVTTESLSGCFVDLLRPFKPHYVADLSRQPETFVDAHHRRNARKALRVVDVEVSQALDVWSDDWTNLYAHLIRHHSISGMQAFSPDSLSAQLRVPGAVALRATQSGTTVAMLVWYVDRDVAYYHLGASSPVGYTLKASFGLFWESLRYFADKGIRWIDLGGAAGAAASDGDGLARFKHGWSTETRTAYLGGRVFDPHAYACLSGGRGIRTGDYFPAYRAGEFV
jgi:hypothetical protein